MGRAGKGWGIMRDLEEVVSAYAECALWSSHDWDDMDDGDNPRPMDDNYSVDDIAPETLAQFREDCAAMIEGAAEIDGADWWDDGQFGHDFWLTRNGHGAGFWDRHYGDSVEASAGDELSALARPYGTVDLYVGDDGKVYS